MSCPEVHLAPHLDHTGRRTNRKRNSDKIIFSRIIEERFKNNNLITVVMNK